MKNQLFNVLLVPFALFSCLPQSPVYSEHKRAFSWTGMEV